MARVPRATPTIQGCYRRALNTAGYLISTLKAGSLLPTRSTRMRVDLAELAQMGFGCPFGIVHKLEHLSQRQVIHIVKMAPQGSIQRIIVMSDPVQRTLGRGDNHTSPIDLI